MSCHLFNIDFNLSVTMSEDFSIKLVAINARYTHSSLALFYIREQLEKHLPEARLELYQFSINESYYDMVLELTEDNPDAVFLSAVIWNSAIMEKLIPDLACCLPESQLVVGGPQADIMRESIGQFCTIIVGQIEGIDEQFYQELIDRNLQPVYRGNSRVVLHQGLPQVYRKEDFPLYLKNRQIYYESSRGCPFSCSYCLSAAEKGVYHKPLSQVKEELALILSHKPKVVRFIDRTYNDNWQRGLAIWKFLMDYDVDTLFHFEIAPDFFTEAMFDFLETVPPGRFQFEIGIQSTHNKTLEAVNRKISTDRVHEIISRLADMANIHLHVDLILGLPFETRETFLHSFAEVFAMKPHYIQMGLLKMLPNTPISKEVEKYNYSFSRTPPYSVFANNWLDHRQLSELYWFCECVEKFLNNRFFVSLWSYLRRIKEPVADIFLQILEIGKEEKLFELAATQEFLCRILVKWASGRDDFSLVRDLLRYDWLRSGHRQFPKCLDFSEGEELFVATRDRLYRKLPEEMPGVYDIRSRNRFFKKAMFWSPQNWALLSSFVNYFSENRALCFLPERDDNLYQYNKVLSL